jgi:hypothetical protein
LPKGRRGHLLIHSVGPVLFWHNKHTKSSQEKTCRLRKLMKIDATILSQIIGNGIQQQVERVIHLVQISLFQQCKVGLILRNKSM